MAGLAPAAGADPVYPAVRWAGTLSDPDLRAKAPAGGLIGTQKDFAALWKGWGLPDPVPDVDFGAHFVVVLTSPGHTVSVMRANVEPDGDAHVLSTQPAGEKERPGFGYALAVFPRAMKTVGGKEIPK
jgi:hypothetical protein